MTFKPTKEQERIFLFTKKRPENLLIKAYAGTGKCLGNNTPILMYDGTIKKVQDITIDDLLMGDDSTPRKVLSINNGYGDLYKIIPQKGDSWICNDVHVLTHHHEQKKKLIDLPLNEINYPKYPNGNYRYARLQRTAVNFKENMDIIDPYLLGLWLGDGSKTDGNPKLTINENETEILDYLLNVKYDGIISKRNKYDGNNVCFTVTLTTENFNGPKIKNVLWNEFRLCYDNNDSIIIPEKYLINSSENRKRLLAGLLDANGYDNGKNFEIITKYDYLANSIVYLCRSLGLAAYKSKKIEKIKSLDFKGNYWKISITGTFKDIPFLRKSYKLEKRKQIKSVLRTGFRKEYIGKGEYYGFTLDGNGRFLLGDFTITHNTTTILEAVKLLPKDKSITFLAFNKHIKDELKTKLPDYVRCYTTYGLGMGAIKRKYGDSIKFDEFKIDKIIQKKSKTWKLNDELDNDYEISMYLNEIKKLVNLSRLTLTLKQEYLPFLTEKYDINLSEKNDFKRVLKVLDTATNDRKTFDYTDMIYLPAIDKSIWMFPQDYVFIDEVQDVNRCQIKIVEKILKRDKMNGKITGRLIAVGDKFQGIYGFNAADEKSFNWFENLSNMKILPLSTSFRCSKAVIEKAKEIVPDIKALENAPEGVVREGNVLTEARSGDFILCRKTTPLIHLFFHFLTKNKKAIIKGSDIGIHLIELIGNINNIDNLISFWENELLSYKKELKNEGILNPSEHSGYSSLEDKVNTLLFLAKLSESIVDLKNKISVVFTDDIDGICLSTIHKIKGLEADRVFIVRPDILPMPVKKPWQYAQEKNLEYVAITRSRLELIYDYEWNDENNA